MRTTSLGQAEVAYIDPGEVDSVDGVQRRDGRRPFPSICTLNLRSSYIAPVRGLHPFGSTTSRQPSLPSPLFSIYLSSPYLFSHSYTHTTRLRIAAKVAMLLTSTSDRH